MQNNKKELETVSKRSNILLVGLTGGIATGKSTVTDLLKEMGAEIIDFDQLARLVVEPGKPALKDISEIFGREILDAKGNLDRKKLSNVVFRDAEKRKKLEEITHSRISEEFICQVTEIAKSRPDAIIIAAVPLLIEVNMQSLFDRIIVVQIPHGDQVERLMKRDGISRDHSLSILNSQLPIRDKLKFADYVINNKNSFENTREQAEELWQSLKQLQRTKTAK